MKAEIISIGDELLIGQTVNTNAAWMGEQLNLYGIDVVQASAVPDTRQRITEALRQAETRANVILITGGLGPTKDDLTKYTLVEYFNTRLVRNEEVLQRIEAFFAARKRPLLEVNRQQADLPENCRILPNRVGTASGMWFEKDGCIYVSMPGVPYEMKYLMEHSVLPLLKARVRSQVIVHRTILTQGIGESFLAELIRDWENRLRADGLSLAYLPSPGIVKLRITARGEEESVLIAQTEKYLTELQTLIPEYIFGREKDTLEKRVGEALVQHGATLSTAESCTGGYIAHRITSVPGSADYFEGSVVSYSNAVKMRELGVKAETLAAQGAVSRETVEEMVRGVREKFGTTYAVAVSGIAGPTGGTEEKPVGTVWIAVASADRIVSRKFLFEQDRERNIIRTAQSALHLLLKFIEEKTLL